MIRKLLIDYIDKSAMSPQASEAHFAIAGNPQLLLRDCPEASLTYLEHRILAHPADLRSHTQRILLLLHRGLVADLPGALVDLYIALGPQGNSLKQTLLRTVQDHLHPNTITFFRQYLRLGFKPWHPNLISIKNSRLAQGYTGTHELVRKLERRTVAYRDVMEEVQSYLEYGQLDAARETLEAALRQAPENDALATELLEIYLRTQDQPRLAAMREFLTTQRAQLPPGW